MEHRSMVEAYLRNDPAVGETSFEQLFMEYFNDHTHISHFSKPLFVMFFLGFNDMLLIDGIAPKYEIDKIFYGWYEEFNMLKAIILTKEDGKRVMKIRSVFLDGITNAAPRLLNKQEWQHIEQEVHGYELRKFVHKKYAGDMTAGSIHDQLTFERYFQGFMASLNDRGEIRVELQNYLSSKKEELSQYIPNVKEYLIRRVKNDKHEITQRSRISFQEIYSRDLSFKKVKLSGQHISNFVPNVFTEIDVNFRDSKLMLLTDDLVHIVQSPYLLEQFKDIFKYPGPENLRVIDILSKFKALYSVQSGILSSSDLKRESAECGFSLGAFLAIGTSDMNSKKIRAIQYIGEEIKDEIYANDLELEHEIEDNNAFFLIVEPGTDSDINSVAQKEPIVITFFDRTVTSDMHSMFKLQNNLISKYRLITCDFSANDIKSQVRRSSIGNTLIEDIVVESQLDSADEANFDGQASMEIYMERLLNKVQAVKLEQRLSDVTYASRYMFGALISSLGRDENNHVYEMRPTERDADPFETTYLISFKSKELDRYVVLNFNENINTEESSQTVSEPAEKFDALFVHVDQDFITDNPNTGLGYIKRKVKVYKALMSTTIQSGEFSLTPIDHVSLDALKMNHDDMIIFFHDKLSNVLHDFKHLVNDPNLPKDQHLIDYSSNFKAVITGLFHAEPSLKNVVSLPNALSTIQYTISGQVDDGVELTRSDTSDTDSMSSITVTADEDEEIDSEYHPHKLITVNFRYMASEDFDQSHVYSGMASMIEKTKLSSSNNQIANFYFFDDKLNGGTDEELVLTKNKYISLCKTSRKKRRIQNCPSPEKDESRESSTTKEIPVEKIEILEGLADVSNSIMLSLMIRDLISDVYHGNKVAIVKDVGFLAATAFSPQIGNYLAQKAEFMLANEAKVSGYATKALGFGVSRAISLYVLYDFISNTVDYVKNNNDSSAKISMEVDGAFLTIDAITLGIQGLEMAGLVYGVSALVNPIGAFIGASIIIGLNVYQTIEKVSQINRIIHLNNREMLDEALRAFFHIDPAKNIEELISEESANQYLMKKATEFLMNQTHYDFFFTKSGVVHGQAVQLRSNAIIDVQQMSRINVSKASPESNGHVQVICKLHEEANEIQSPTFWTHIENFFSKVANAFKTIYHVIQHQNFEIIANDVLDGQSQRHLIQYGYICHNSFGVKLVNHIIGSKTAFFNLGDGNDIVNGFADKPNWFNLGHGKKFINGSAESDIFIITKINITGVLNGSNGIDTVDFSAVDSTEAFFLSDGSSNHNKLLKIKNVENIVGRKSKPDVVICDCSVNTIQLNGGYENYSDVIIVPHRNCTYNITVYMDGFTTVHNMAHQGNFVYITNITRASKISLQLQSQKSKSWNVHNIMLSKSFLSLRKIITIADAHFDNKVLKFYNINTDGFSILRDRNQSQCVTLCFIDGCCLNLNDNNVMHLTLISKLPMSHIISKYRRKVKALGIPMIAHSLIDNETLTITASSRKNSNIMHNSLFHKSKISIESCGNHLLLINATSSDMSVYFPSIQVRLRNCSCSQLTIDFNILLSHLHMSKEWGSLELFAKRINDNMLILASARDQSIGNHYFGKITLVNAFKNECYKNLVIRSYGDSIALNESKPVDPKYLTQNNDLNQDIDHYMENLLEPQPLVYNSTYKFIMLSEKNTEWFSVLHIDAMIAKMEFFRVANESLLITNMRTLRDDNLSNLCSIYFENFYESAKLWTMMIEANFFSMNLLLHIDELKSAGDITELVKSVIHT